MQPNQPLPSQPTTIYKAPQKGKGHKLLEEGFQPDDFPYNPPYFDFPILNQLLRLLKPR